MFARYKDKIMRPAVRTLLREGLLDSSTEVRQAVVSTIEVSPKSGSRCTVKPSLQVPASYGDCSSISLVQGILRAEEEQLEAAAQAKQGAPQDQTELAAFGGNDMGYVPSVVRRCKLEHHTDALTPPWLF